MELVVDGRRVFAATGGRPFDPGMPALVFLHGAGMDHTVWALQTRFFAHHGRSVLALDLPGHGRSEGPPLDSIEAAAAWLARLIEAATEGLVALAGHSMGSLVALEAAARAPARIEKLALLGSALAMPVNETLLTAARAGGATAYAMVTDWGFGRAAHVGGHRGPGLWMTGAGLRLLEQGAPDLLGIDLGACNAYQGGAVSAAAVRCPALVLSGAADRMTPPRAAESLAAALACGRMTVLARAGHMMMVEQPDATLDALRDFI